MHLSELSLACTTHLSLQIPTRFFFPGDAREFEQKLMVLMKSLTRLSAIYDIAACELAFESLSAFQSGAGKISGFLNVRDQNATLPMLWVGPPAASRTT